MANDRTEEIDLDLARTDWQGRPEWAFLHIETGRYSRGGVRSNARVFWHGEGRSRTHAFGLGTGCGDFDRDLKYAPAARVTQRMIDAQHAQVFTAEAVAAIAETAKAFYRKAA